MRLSPSRPQRVQAGLCLPCQLRFPTGAPSTEGACPSTTVETRVGDRPCVQWQLGFRAQGQQSRLEGAGLGFHLESLRLYELQEAV